MNTLLFFSYLLTISAIIASPGPNAALMVSHAINYGKKALILNALGSIGAAVILIGLALLLIDQSIPQAVFPYLTIAGALYLIYIGYKNITSNTVDIDVPKVKTSGALTKSNFFSQSFLTGISNPKDIIFFSVFTPVYRPFYRFYFGIHIDCFWLDYL